MTSQVTGHLTDFVIVTTPFPSLSPRHQTKTLSRRIFHTHTDRTWACVWRDWSNIPSIRQKAVTKVTLSVTTSYLRGYSVQGCHPKCHLRHQAGVSTCYYRAILDKRSDYSVLCPNAPLRWTVRSHAYAEGLLPVEVLPHPRGEENVKMKLVEWAIATWSRLYSSIERLQTSPVAMGNRVKLYKEMSRRVLCNGHTK